MNKKILVIDPVTRIEGHLKIKAVVENNTVKEAFSSGILFRGFEIFLKGRDPRDAQKYTQRVCGVCPVSHATASAFALDTAFNIATKIPYNGRIVRNIIFASNFIQSHILHFYHLASLDYVDITAAKDYEGEDKDLLTIKNFINSGSLEPFVPRYEGDYRLPSKLNIELSAHYIQALRIRRKAHELLSIFGGKIPHDMGIVPGGATSEITQDKIFQAFHLIEEIQYFINNCYLPDILTLAKYYPDYLEIGKGSNTFLTYGVFDLDTENSDCLNRNRLFPQGIISFPLTYEKVNISNITEYVKYSWYSDCGGNTTPEMGETIPDEDKSEAYSWLKAPRYNSKPVEVGPLARLLSAYITKQSYLNQVLSSVISHAGIQIEQFLSVLGRHIARAIETKIVSEMIEKWLFELKEGETCCIESNVPSEAEGKGLVDAPRGALGHWLKIKNGFISNYQMVVPTTWNASPRDANGIPGPIEQALTGIKIKDINYPYEILRTVRSFDPCLACAVHLYSPNKKLIGIYEMEL